MEMPSKRNGRLYRAVVGALEKRDRVELGAVDKLLSSVARRRQRRTVRGRAKSSRQSG